MTIKYVTSVAVALLALLATALPSAAAGDTLGNARDATAIYNDPAAALAAGYDLLTDASNTACIDMPGMGAMGVHYVKTALVQSGTLDPTRPQALVYEVQPNGQLHLVALEYVVFQAAWDAAHGGTPPTLFGQKFMLNPDGNRFGLPAFYSLHAWIFKRNPTGTFSPWNPDVHCGGPSGTAQNVDQAQSDPADEMVMGAAYLCPMPSPDAAMEGM
jgi:hypothetical protein